jgi:hypothetical protein
MTFRRAIHVSVAVVALLWAACAVACNVPVFRYALERWQNDLYHVVVFHKGNLSADDKKRVDDIGRRSALEGGTANLEVTSVDVTQPFEPGIEDLWKTVPKDAQLPFVLLQSRMGRDKTLTVWEGPLSSVNLDALTHSRDRQEIVDRLLKGHSAVWVVLPGKDETATHNTVDLIETELNRLQDELPLPEGIGQPGSEVYSEIPLTLRFSVYVLKPGPEADALLPEMMKRVAPGAAADGQALVTPVFGRGRAVDVIPGDKVDEATVEDLSRFICGACSCQVKEQNPGFDLLMAVKWNERLFSPDVLPPPDNPKKQKTAELVAIAPGPVSAPGAASASPSGATAQPAASQPKPAVTIARVPSPAAPIELTWIQAWFLSCIVIALLFGWAIWSGRAT